MAKRSRSLSPDVESDESTELVCTPITTCFHETWVFAWTNEMDLKRCKKPGYVHVRSHHGEAGSLCKEHWKERMETGYYNITVSKVLSPGKIEKTGEEYEVQPKAKRQKLEDKKA
jgi:hypothetical protein